MREVKELVPGSKYDPKVRTDKDKIKELFKSTPVEVVTSWQEFVPLTADITGVDEGLLKDIIEHIFSFVKAWINNPTDKAAILLNELGSFELNLSHINKMIVKMIPYLRGKDRDLFIAKFKWYWQARQLAIAYKIKRTSTNRRFFPAKQID